MTRASGSVVLTRGLADLLVLARAIAALDLDHLRHLGQRTIEPRQPVGGGPCLRGELEALLAGRVLGERGAQPLHVRRRGLLVVAQRRRAPKRRRAGVGAHAHAVLRHPLEAHQSLVGQRAEDLRHEVVELRPVLDAEVV
jgi:hypothetical protein